MAADPWANYAVPRHAPRPEVAGPDLEHPGKPIASFSRPAQASDVAGTSDIVNRASLGNRRPRGAMGTGSLQGGVESPLGDIAAAHEEIATASGIGRRPALDDWASDVSDRNEDRPASTGDMGDPASDHPLMAKVRASMVGTVGNYFAGDE